MPKTYDLTGQTFGRLTVLEKTDKRHKASIVYRCMCSCGNESARSQKELVHDRIQSCGCLRTNFRKTSEVSA